MTEDQEREQFEQAAHEHYLAERSKRQIKDDFEVPATRENLLWRQPSGEYGVLMFNAAWWAWKARAALAVPWVDEVTARRQADADANGA